MTMTRNTPKPPAPASKIAQVMTMLSRDQGATLADISTVTGWLPHTVRAALTGLRKKGQNITRDSRGEETCYRISGQD